MKNLIICLLVFSSLSLFAQNAGNIWYFGQNAGLNFNTNPPSPLAGGQINTIEGCSSIADPVTGNLLFYSDGITVWDKNHNPMPASLATPLNGDPSSTQSGVIVPQPGNPSIYYIFTTPAQLGSWTFTSAAMCYSIVDMTLNGGNGDLTSVNNVLIDSATEKIAGIGNCNGSEYWIAGHQWGTNNFYVYKLTAAGLSAPVISSVGAVHQDIGSGQKSESIGYMKFSSDGKKLGLVTYVNLNVMELFDFNSLTGTVSNPITEVYPFDPNNNLDGLYGCSFSPDNSKFYVSFFSQFASSTIYQYDLNAPNPAAILASKTSVATALTPFGAIQNGPNGKMYISSFGVTTLDVINNPNLSGAACSYTAATQNIAGTTTFGLPVIIESFLTVAAPPLFNLPAEDKICIGDTIHAPQTTKNTFSIQPNSYSVNADSSMVNFFPTTTTTYTIVNTSDCATNDTTLFTITIVPPPVADFIFDPAVPTLRDATITLLNQSQLADHYEWYENNTLHGTSTDYTVSNPGLGTFCYTLIAYNTLGCSNTVTKCVKIKDSVLSTFFIPNVFTPNGDGLNDIFRVKGKNIHINLFSIYDRFGQLLFQTDDLTTGWNGDYKGVQCEVGTYFYLIHYSDAEGSGKIEKGDLTLIR
ncbi:MAG: gliding motility-associated C-terminal domain-containing protein [Chitinophagaceae bacterium]|nr:gliding motility-associated C-terminal domain-containing protein [Chitinophagaceae bacterium]